MTTPTATPAPAPATTGAPITDSLARLGRAIAHGAFTGIAHDPSLEADARELCRAIEHAAMKRAFGVGASAARLLASYRGWFAHAVKPAQVKSLAQLHGQVVQLAHGVGVLPTEGVR